MKTHLGRWNCEGTFKASGHTKREGILLVRSPAELIMSVKGNALGNPESACKESDGGLTCVLAVWKMQRHVTEVRKVLKEKHEDEGQSWAGSRLAF